MFFHHSSTRKKRTTHSVLSFFIGFRRRPKLPGRVQPSTFGTERLNFCVRDGNRCDPLVIATGNCELVLLLFSFLFSVSAFASVSFLRFPGARCFLAFPFPLHPDNCIWNDSSFSGLFQLVSFFRTCVQSSPRPISIIKLHLLPNFHR